MPLNTVSGVIPRTDRLFDCGFGLGTRQKGATSPCLYGTGVIKGGMLLLSIGGGANPMNVAAQLIDGNVHGYTRHLQNPRN